MSTAPPPAVPTDTQQIVEPPGGSEGITRMADAFERLRREASGHQPEGEWVTKPQPSTTPQGPQPQVTPPPSPPPAQPAKQPEPPPPAPAKPSSPFEFKPVAAPQPEPPAAPAPDSGVPAEIKSPVARDHFKALEQARDEQATRASQLEAKLKALEKELESSKGKAVDSEAVELIRKENEELSRRVTLLDVTQHPKFQSYFGGKEKQITDQITSAAGPETSKAVLDLLRMPDTTERGNMLAEAISQLPIWNQQKITNYAMMLDALRVEREQAISEAGKARETLLRENEQTETLKRNERNQTFNGILAQAQDAKRGLEVLVPRDGDEAHNARVRAAAEQARTIYEGKLEPDDMARAALWAASAPLYQEAVTIQAALIRKYEDQIRTLQGTQPGLVSRGSAAPNAETPGENGGSDFTKRVLGLLNPNRV